MDGFFKFGSPTLELSIETRKVEMLLDTGFNGHLMLPQIIIDELGLEQIGISDYLAASGEHTATKVYKGEIRFLDEKMEVSILSTNANFSLAGMELFDKCKIVLDRPKNIVEVAKSE